MNATFDRLRQHAYSAASKWLRIQARHRKGLGTTHATKDEGSFLFGSESADSKAGRDRCEYAHHHDSEDVAR